MPTIVNRSVGIDGGSYDYSSFNSLYVAEYHGQNLVSADILLRAIAEGTWATPLAANLTPSSDAAAVDATRYLEITTDSANAAPEVIDYSRFVSDVGGVVWSYMRLVGIQVDRDGAAGLTLTATSTVGGVIDSCTLLGGLITVVSTGTASLTVRNTSIFNADRNAVRVGVDASVVCEHVTAAKCGWGGFGSSGSTSYVINNCLSYSPAGSQDDFAGLTSGSGNISSDGSAGSTAIGDPFIDFAGGDYTLDPTDPEGIAGLGASGIGIGVDKLGQDRPANPTPGAYELAPAGGDPEGEIIEASGEATEEILGGVIVSATLGEAALSATDSILGATIVAGSLIESATGPAEEISGGVITSGALNETADFPSSGLSGSIIAAGSLEETAVEGTESIADGGTVSGTIAEVAGIEPESITGNAPVTGLIYETANAPTEAIGGTLSAVSVDGAISETAQGPTEAIGGRTLVAGSIAEASAEATEAIGTIAHQLAPLARRVFAPAELRVILVPAELRSTIVPAEVRAA